ncbi:hypothetical protein AWL63_14995 [Sphingomonas panacis]|uniref:Thioredoxin peroxidase n=1 Tax=Sphingomonas panacis TaxID=1560345 RepID=A0A1B3ZCA9_9SPHN|nr:hypothetical protein AWL63_14995 [Sphingomonas panacis]
MKDQIGGRVVARVGFTRTLSQRGFVALCKASDRFEALDCALLAVSVDGLYSHLGWIRAIRDGFGVTVSFPIIEDSSLIIGRAYGMMSDRSRDSATMRSTYSVDPDGIIRAMICYPATIGRSVDEMLRVHRRRRSCRNPGRLASRRRGPAAAAPGSGIATRRSL